MPEQLTKGSADDAIDAANNFLSTERGSSLDGDFASIELTRRVVSVQEHAEYLLTANPINNTGLYAPLASGNVDKFHEVATTLAGYFVLVQSNIIEPGSNSFYLATVSSEGSTKEQMSLHVFMYPYKAVSKYASSLLLSAAGQSEMPGIGDHSRVTNDGIEAEHFPTLLAAGVDTVVLDSWKNGNHINHIWRKNPESSVLTEVSTLLFDQSMRQRTVILTKSQVEKRKAALYWHEEMRDDITGEPDAATKQGALLVVQGLGFQSLKEKSPIGLSVVKSLLS